MKRLLRLLIIWAILETSIIPALAQVNLLSLTDCVRKGVSSNLGLLKKELEKENRKNDIEIARRVYIPEISLDLNEAADRRKNLNLDQSISQTGKDGSRYRFRTIGSRELEPSPTNSRSHSFSLTRPLLRNFGKKITGHEIDLSRIDYDIAIEKFKSDLNAFIHHLAATYFDLVLAERNLEIQELAVKRAKQQFEDTRHDIELGTIAEQEIYLVEENLVEFEVKRENARHDITLLELELRRNLNEELASEANLLIDPASLDLFDEAATFSESLEHLWKNNPDYLMKTLLHQRSISELEFQQNQFLPELDLKADYRWREGAGVSKNNSYSFGFQYSVPLSRTADRAEVDKTRLNARIQRLSVDDAKLVLAYELKRMFLEIDHLNSIHQAKIRTVELSQKKLNAESEKYKNGFSTLADIVRFQRELENSMIDELQTLISLKKARLERLLLEGTLFRRFGIEFDS